MKLVTDVLVIYIWSFINIFFLRVVFGDKREYIICKILVIDYKYCKLRLCL